MPAGPICTSSADRSATIFRTQIESKEVADDAPTPKLTCRRCAPWPPARRPHAEGGRVIAAARGPVEVPARPRHQREHRRRHGARLRVWAERRVLDGELARGLDPEEDDLRALRARQLTAPPARRCVAACLSNILDACEERHSDPSARLQLRHAEVLAARHEIVAVVEGLRSSTPVTAQGVALARQLIDDGSSPLLRAHAGLTVADAVAQTLRALPA